MNQTEKLPQFGRVEPFLQPYNLSFVVKLLTDLVEGEEYNMRNMEHIGSRGRRLEFGQKALDLLQLMYGWEK